MANILQVIVFFSFSLFIIILWWASQWCSLSHCSYIRATSLSNLYFVLEFPSLINFVCFSFPSLRFQ